MSRVEEVKKAFHKARIEGEKRLQKTTTDAEFRIEWGKYAFVMLGFEAKLRSMGVVL
jgi:hypothetical protein